MKEIQKDPERYIEQGGVLPESKATTATFKVHNADFIIHRNLSNSDATKDVDFETLYQLCGVKDQTSEEYRQLKEAWLKKYQLLYENSNAIVSDENGYRMKH
eukprot:CAMPEP_0172509026 /NCGR_PEP_ID=MMETSP1066-20121228/217044_1 /TAXON_ID=671091 /ORGANISM="Coscinodiscus wailesii, Strain CCMP2513" /LENGTH=101 /DNA_ID=CAMNT_0013287325 /DNA_START=84 /DNA_END=389 /DNA_ORIENTATION=+